MELIILNGCKNKESFEKTRHAKNNGNLKSRFYMEIEMDVIMIEFYLIQRNLIISRLVVYKKAYDISRKGSHPHPTPTPPTYSPPKSQ